MSTACSCWRRSTTPRPRCASPPRSPAGTLRVTCGVSFGTRYLAAALAEFGAQHPDLVLDLDLSDRVVDLVEDGFDLAVRIGHIGSKGMVSKRIGWTQIVCCAAPSYLARRREPITTPEDLAQHECLSYTLVGLPNVWHFERAGVATRASPCASRCGTGPTMARCSRRWPCRDSASSTCRTSSSRTRFAAGNCCHCCRPAGPRGHPSPPCIPAAGTCRPRCARASISWQNDSSARTSGASHWLGPD